MTGEVTLQGRVLPIGGLKQKVLAAHAAGLTDVILPERNRGDLDDVPEDVRDEMTFHPVMTIDEVLELALEPQPPPAAWRRVTREPPFRVEGGMQRLADAVPAPSPAARGLRRRRRARPSARRGAARGADLTVDGAPRRRRGGPVRRRRIECERLGRRGQRGLPAAGRPDARSSSRPCRPSTACTADLRRPGRRARARRAARRARGRALRAHRRLRDRALGPQPGAAGRPRPARRLGASVAAAPRRPGPGGCGGGSRLGRGGHRQRDRAAGASDDRPRRGGRPRAARPRRLGRWRARASPRPPPGGRGGRAGRPAGSGPSGSRGAKVSLPPWSRMPPRPATQRRSRRRRATRCAPRRGCCASQVVEVHQGGLGEVVVGELEVADLGGDHRLGAGRQRRVAHGAALVVVEVARLLLGA